MSENNPYRPLSQVEEGISSTEDETICRICLDDTQDSLFSPCRCSGTNKYVHRECLNTWRATSQNPDAFNKCFSCQYKYRYQSHPETHFTRCTKFNHKISDSPGMVCCFLFFSMIGITYLARVLDNNQVILNFYRRFGTKFLKHDLLTNDFFLYYVFVADLVFIIICSAFFINILRMKNRRLYLKYCFGPINFFRYIFIILVFIVILAIFFMSSGLAAVCLTFMIQFFVRTHYNFIRHLHRATSTNILEYDPTRDTNNPTIQA